MLRSIDSVGPVPASTSLDDNVDKQSVCYLPTIPKVLRTILQRRWLCCWQNNPTSHSCFNSSASNQQNPLAKSCLLNSTVAQPSIAFSPSSPSSNQYFGNGNISESE
mmetsp:Transcript_5549/g.9937  ORF Transcript_5549/g.9937 Transcript_5549/m.9937 type:complete len:107 (-) Transcript_5549:311-631(-)